MRKVKIITDSCSDLNEEIIKELDIEVVPLCVIIEGKTYYDNVDIKLPELYDSVKRTGELPHTAGISPADFAKVYQKYIDEDYDIVHISLGSELSTTFQSVRLAAMDMPEDRVFIIDTQSLSTGISLIILKACKLRDEGKSAKEIAEEVSKYVPNIVAQFTLETLDYLHKGGRCSGASKVVGQLLHIHPYIYVQNGKLIVYKKPRGPMKLAINEQLNELKKDLPVEEDAIFITHTIVDPELANFAREGIKKLVPNAVIRETTAGSVIGSHCGPGTLGILYIKKNK